MRIYEPARRMLMDPRRKHLMLTITCCLLVVTSLSCSREEPALNTDRSAEKVIAEIKEALPRLMDEAGIPGLSIALIRDGGTAWSGAYGVKSTVTAEPVTEATVFEAASLTKPLFAYFVMKMVQNGELDLDRPLYEYAPVEHLEEEYIGHPIDREGFNTEWFKTITARMVLSHSSGLPHGEPRDPLPVHFEPGTEYRYSADGYYYLQVVVEYLRSETLDEIMRKEVIEPLGMNSSSMVWQDRYEAVAAVGHDIAGETDGEFRKRNRAYASATLYTTAVDYARFVNAVINDMGLDGATVEAMLSPQIEVEDGVHWSLGFGLDEAQCGTGFWQWGDFGIFRNYVIAYKEERIGVVYLTNSFNGLSIRDDVIDLTVGGGEHPAFSYPTYEQHYTPIFRITQTALRQGVAAAIDLYEQLYAGDPEGITWEVLNASGNTLRYSNRAGEAVALLEVNAGIYPDSSDSFLYLGEAYYENAQYSDAIESFERTLEMDSEHEGAAMWLNRAELMQTITMRCPDAGLDYLRQLREAYPETNWEAHINAHGYALLFGGKTLDAITIFKFNLGAFPESWNVYDSLAEAYMENGDRELAIYYYMESLRRNPENTNGAERLKKLK
jgi:CubicO group peptidase (beta-lactamase class C family)